MRLRLGISLLVLVVASAAVSAAFAKAPPKRKYECVIGDPAVLFGNIVIESGSAYTYGGKPGTYKTGAKKRHYPDGTSGFDIRFTSGPLAGKKHANHGHWYKATGGAPNTYEIALINPLDGYESIYCETSSK